MRVRKVNIGIIGCGRQSELHAFGYLRIPEKAKIGAVADAKGGLAKAKARKWGVTEAFSDYRALLNLNSIDAVDICLPHFLHADATIAAAEAGKDILCEKPMGTSLKEADDIISATRKSGVKLMVGYNQRFLPYHAKAKELVNHEALGKMKLATATIQAEYLPSQKGDWRLAKRKAGGGVLIDSGSHRIDLLRWLVGDIKRIFCKISPTESEVEDTAFAIVEFNNGVIGQIMISSAIKGALWGKNWNETLLLSGSKGTIMTENKAASLRFYGENLPLQLRGFINSFPSFSYFDTFHLEVEHFVNCILDDTQPLISGEDGRGALATIIAAYASAEEERYVDVPKA